MQKKANHNEIIEGRGIKKNEMEGFTEYKGSDQS